MQVIDGIPIWATPVDEGALAQIKNCARTADQCALMADAHKGYAVPIGGVVAYQDKISPSGVGFDIACGNKAVLTDADVTAEIIADGVHVAGPAIQMLLGTKGFDTVLLVSDGTAATGMRDGNYKLGNFDVAVKDGVVRNSEGKLAGSTLTLDRALRYVVELGVPLVDAIRMATILPARRLGLSGKKGIIAVGADADLVVLTPDLHVAGVMTRGVGLN